MKKTTDAVEAFVKVLTMREKMVFTDCLSKYVDKENPGRPNGPKRSSGTLRKGGVGEEGVANADVREVI